MRFIQELFNRKNVSKTELTQDRSEWLAEQRKKGLLPLSDSEIAQYFGVGLSQAEIRILNSFFKTSENLTKGNPGRPVVAFVASTANKSQNPIQLERQSPEDTYFPNGGQPEYLVCTEPFASGGFGTIWITLNLNILRIEAMKLTTEDESIQMEARIQAKNYVPNVIRVYSLATQWLLDPDNSSPTSRLVMFMEFMGNDKQNMYEILSNKKQVPGLFEKISERNVFTPAAIVSIFTDLATCVADFSARGIRHSDLKSDNIWIVKDKNGLWHPIIGDFGAAKKIGAPDINAATWKYVPYESVIHKMSYGVSTELSALGFVLLELITGKTVYDISTQYTLNHDAKDNYPEEKRFNVNYAENDEYGKHIQQLLAAYCDKYRLDRDKVLTFFSRVCARNMFYRIDEPDEFIALLKDAFSSK